MVWLIGLELTVREISRVEIAESTKEYRNPVFLRAYILLMAAQNPIIIAFSKRAKQIN